MINGDFSVRLKHSSALVGTVGINEICDCFNKMAEELSGIETLSSDFIANVSHELKTPLAAIGNYAAMLSSPTISDEERLEYAAAISESSRRLSELVSNILRLNKLENSQIFPSTSRYELGEQLCECLLGFESVWEEKNITIETDIEQEVFVKTDSEMMKLVWNNLLSNAFKFTDAGGSVSLALRTDGRLASVTVTDTGCGISSDDGARIFDKFYQADLSRATQGNGLGLALVKRVIDITGSEISVSSVQGKGSTFTVRLALDSIRSENDT
jgi:signal transduction histidine kinase